MTGITHRPGESAIVFNAWNDAEPCRRRDDAAPAVGKFHLTLQLRKHFKKFGGQLLIASLRIHKLWINAAIKVVTHSTTTAPGNSIVVRQTELVEHVDMGAERVA